MKTLVISAPVYSLSGYGARSRDIVTSLFDSGKFNIVLAIPGWGGTSNSVKLPTRQVEIFNFCSQNQLHITDKEFTYVHVGIPSEFRAIGKVNVGITAGLECTHISKEWVSKCNLMDTVIVSSNFARQVFINCGVTVPVVVLPEGVNREVFNTQEKTFPFSFSSSFNFLCVGQWGAPGFDRKQIGLLLDVFVSAFKGRSDIGLVLKTFINNLSTSDREFTVQFIRERVGSINDKPPIHLVHGEMTLPALKSLYQSCQVFVSLTSGEGWNRPAAEALCCGLPVMVPNWSGHLDFVLADKELLFNTTLTPVPPQYLQSTPWFTPDSKWCMINPEEVISKLQNIVHNYDRLKEKTLQHLSNLDDVLDLSVYTKLVTILASLGSDGGSSNVAVSELNINNNKVSKND